MNYQTHSPLSLDLVLLCAGMVVILAIPFYLRSSINKNIDVPPEERNINRFSIFSIIKFVLLLAVATYLLLGLSRVVKMSVLADAGAIIVLVALFVVGQKPKPKSKEDPS